MRLHTRASTAGWMQRQFAGRIGIMIAPVLALLVSSATAQALTPPTQAFTAFAAPRATTSARLNARINPEGASFTYRFEYSDDGGATWTSLPAKEYSGTGMTQIVVGEDLTGLLPGTTYSYRFTAENGSGPASPGGQVKTFTTRTEAETAGPNRGYELVNNADKGNQNVRTETQQKVPPISPDGERAVWSVLGGAPGGNIGAGATFLAKRTPSGWQSTSLVPVGQDQPGEGRAGGYALDSMTPGLISFVFNAGISALERGHALARVTDDQQQTILQDYGREIGGSLVDMTEDGTQVLFVNPNTKQLEAMGDGPTEVVSIMPDGLPNECGLDSGEGLSFTGASGGAFAAAEELWLPGYHLMATTDGQRVYFEAEPNGSPCSGFNHFGLYERNRASGQTVLIDPGANGRAPEAIRATPDGREFYFVTWSNLDPADTNSQRDIYVWRETEGKSTCLTCIVPSPSLPTYQSSATRVILVSNDFSHIYFESTGELVPGQGRLGDNNIYVLSHGTLRFVADPDENGGKGALGNARLSTNGDVLLYHTDASSPHYGLELTADKLAEKCNPNRGQSSPENCEELFRYDDRDESLECISCNHDGVTERDVVGFSGLLGGSAYSMSPDGNTIAFITAEQLVPADVNRDVDIYEWRNGVRRLISDGLTVYPSGLAEPQVTGISEGGRDVFFQLDSPGLTGYEQDGFTSLYDARIDGGFPRPAQSAHCSGESCQAPIQAPPSVAGVTSAGFQGSGNIHPRKFRECGKRKVRRRGRCVKRRRHSVKHRHRRAHGRHRGRTAHNREGRG